jgi:hypothetical protein
MMPIFIVMMLFFGVGASIGYVWAVTYHDDNLVWPWSATGRAHRAWERQYGQMLSRLMGLGMNLQDARVEADAALDRTSREARRAYRDKESQRDS